MPSLGSKLIRGALEKDLPALALGTAGGAAGAAMAANEDQPDPQTLLMQMLLGAAGGAVGGKVAKSAIRHSPLVGNPAVKHVPIHKEYSNRQYTKESLREGNIPGAASNILDRDAQRSMLIPSADGKLGNIQVRFTPTTTIPGLDSVGVSMDLPARYADLFSTMTAPKATLKQTEDIFKKTFAAVDNYAAKKAPAAFMFVGASGSHTKLYRTALRRGYTPEGYVPYELTDSAGSFNAGFALLKKTQVKAGLKSLQKEGYDVKKLSQGNKNRRTG